MDESSAILEPTDDDRGKGALQLSAVVYAGRSKWEGSIRLRSFETARDAMQLALRSASVSDDRIFTVRITKSLSLCLVTSLSLNHPYTVLVCSL